MDDTSDTNETKPKRKGGGALIAGVGIAGMVAAPLWFFMIGPQVRHDRLVENGIKTEGRLLSVAESGTTINDVTELELVVEFTRKDGKLDTTETDFLPTMRTIHLFQPGVAVKVAYDAEDPDEITIMGISDGPPTGSASSMGAMNNAPNVDSLRRLADSLKLELEKVKR